MFFKLLGSLIVILSSLLSIFILYEILVINNILKFDYHLIYFLIFGLFASILPLIIINKSRL